MTRSVRARFLACVLAAATLATIGGALYDAIQGGMTMTRAIAYGFWVAAALTLVLMALAASNRLARRFDLPFVESWLFVAASVLFIAAGIGIDALGA
jgi:hypothetical protein